MTTTPPASEVCVTKRIDAPAETIFAILADPVRHPSIDGSGMVQKALTRSPVTAVGDEFLMAMHNDEMGRYEMANRVIAFEANRIIGWEPRLHRASRPEDQAEIGNPAYHVWGYRLEPVDRMTTNVTEYFDCTRSPEWLRTAVRGGQRWVESMTITLEKLERLTQLQVSNAEGPPT
jgi:hypothetical protein